MAQNKEKLLDDLQQLKADNPQMSEAELTAHASAHFSAAGISQTNPSETLADNQATSATLDNQTATDKPVADFAERIELDEPAELKTEPIELETEPVELKTEPTEPETEPSELETELVEIKSEQAELATEPTKLAKSDKSFSRFNLYRKAKTVICIAAVFFAVVLAGTKLFLFFMPSESNSEDLRVFAADLADSPAFATGDVVRFGNRFDSHASHYDSKYQGHIIEMVGYVETLERTDENEVTVTLVLADKRNKVHRARYRFLPGQEEPVQLLPGTIAVLKGRYQGYKDKVITCYPSVVVFNSGK